MPYHVNCELVGLWDRVYSEIDRSVVNIPSRGKEESFLNIFRVLYLAIRLIIVLEHPIEISGKLGICISINRKGVYVPITIKL